MEIINGKVLITTDWHIGLKQNSKSRLNIIIKVVKEYLIPILKKIIANFADLCKMVFPESPICDLFN